MRPFNVPTKENVSSKNQELLKVIEKEVGMIPNIYAAFAYSDYALEKYMNFKNQPNSFTAIENEIISLSVSKINGCEYCQRAHATIAKNKGASTVQINASLGLETVLTEKENALLRVTKSIIENKGKISDDTLNQFFAAGYTKAHLIDLSLLIAETTITNYVHNITDVEIDFPKL